MRRTASITGATFHRIPAMSTAEQYGTDTDDRPDNKRGCTDASSLRHANDVNRP